MLIKLFDRYSNVLDNDFTLNIGPYPNLCDITIPYSEFFSKRGNDDIYSGDERIPFESRDPEYKSILLKEFLK